MALCNEAVLEAVEGCQNQHRGLRRSTRSGGQGVWFFDATVSAFGFRR